MHVARYKVTLTLGTVRIAPGALDEWSPSVLPGSHTAQGLGGLRGCGRQGSRGTSHDLRIPVWIISRTSFCLE